MVGAFSIKSSTYHHSVDGVPPGLKKQVENSLPCTCAWIFSCCTLFSNSSPSIALILFLPFCPITEAVARYVYCSVPAPDPADSRPMIPAVRAVDDLVLCFKVLFCLFDYPVPPRTAMPLLFILLAVITPLIQVIWRLCGWQLLNGVKCLKHPARPSIIKVMFCDIRP